MVCLVALAVAVAGCGGGGGGGGSRSGASPSPIVVNSLDDLADPPDGTVTLRSALADAKPGQPIAFDAALDGGVIALTLVAEEHTVLKGEVMGIRDEPSGPVSYLVGYFKRDYGRSALYARKDVVIDASALPSGITLAWTGGEAARVLAVFGDLTMKNLTVTGGRSETEDISADDPDQPWTLARGAGIAVWGKAKLRDCSIHDNHCVGDFDSSRDRGAFGGGVYANLVDLEDCVIAGNTVLGGGAAGGGVYSVGGADGEMRGGSTVERCSVTGNRIQGLFAYGAGLYSDGGGIGNSTTLRVANSTIARNVVEPPPFTPPFLLAIGYWRAGGIYISNGSLRVTSCTVVENETYGAPRTDSLGRPNLAGGVAATIGNAHAVENMILTHSIIVGNTVTEMGPGGVTYPHDVFTGSLFAFKSRGYNRIGVIDFSQILVPVGQWGWKSLCRRHYPKEGDEDGVLPIDVLDPGGGVTHSATILSAGVDAGQPTVLHYRPTGDALDRVPASPYEVKELTAEYLAEEPDQDDFLAIFLARLESHHGLPGFAATFTSDFEAYLATVDLDEDTPGNQPYEDPDGNPILTIEDTHWFGPKNTWPKEVPNHAYIEFWHHLDLALMAEPAAGLGPEVLGDDAWAALFDSGWLTENDTIYVRVTNSRRDVSPGDADQTGTPRPKDTPSDIGAIEVP
jgi:hypothetical protein